MFTAEPTKQHAQIDEKRTHKKTQFHRNQYRTDITHTHSLTHTPSDIHMQSM